MEFYKDYSFFLKEGIVTSNDQYEKEEISRLLRFECSSLPAGETVELKHAAARWRRQLLCVGLAARVLRQDEGGTEGHLLPIGPQQAARGDLAILRESQEVRN